MKILEVTHYMPPHSGGIENVAAALVSGLSERGHDVRWIAAASPEPPGERGPCWRVPAWNFLERRLGVPYPLWSPSGLRRLGSLARWADVVHVHDCLYVGSAAASHACRVARTPVLLTQHVGHVPYGRALDVVQRLAYRTLGRAVLGAATRRVACSAHVPEWFRRLGFRGDFEVIPNAADTLRFRPPSRDARRAARERFGIPPEARVVLFVGRLVAKKGVERVAAAQRVLAREGVVLLAVGDGPLTSLLSAAPQVRSVPGLPPAEMPEAYAASDAFLLPSRGEGLPLAVQEAMLCGLPAVVSDDPAFVRNLSGAPGVSIATDDDALVRMLRDATRGGPDPHVVAAFARDRWDPARFLDRYEQIVRELHEGRLA